MINHLIQIHVIYIQAQQLYKSRTTEIYSSMSFTVFFLLCGFVRTDKSFGQKQIIKIIHKVYIEKMRV